MFPASSGASGSRDGGGTCVCLPCSWAAHGLVHTRVLLPHSHARTLLREHVRTHGPAAQRSLTHAPAPPPRSVAALRGGRSIPEHPRAGRKVSRFSNTPRTVLGRRPPPWRGLSYPRPGAPALAWPVCGQSPGCLSTLQCVTGARASPREELSARVPSGQSGPPRIPLTALRWVPRQPLREGLGLTLTLCSVETLRGRPARGGGRRQEEEAGTGDHGPRSDGGPCWAQG